jgi:hypothetical protein
MHTFPTATGRRIGGGPVATRGGRSSTTTRPALTTARRRGGSAPRVVPAAAAADAPTPTPTAASAGPSTPPPDYASTLDRNPLNAAIMHLFRARMVQALGGADSPLPQGDYRAIIDLTRRLNAQPPGKTRAQTRAILLSLFPSWLPRAFAVLFSRFLPGFSARLNAWATALTCQWLMGPCAVVDVEPAPHAPSAFSGVGMGVKVDRCRYLEEAGCAAVCANSCRLPTQAFFARDMGLPLSMEPNFEDFSCTFRFGHRAPEEAEAWPCEGRGGGGEGCGAPAADDPVLATACFAQCPSKRSQGPLGVCGGIFEDAEAVKTAARVLLEAKKRNE